jgi:hypothetical protein
VWWPEKEKSRFKEPDHLNKVEALWVATYIFQYVIEDQDRSKLKALECRTNKLDLTTKKEQQDGHEAKARARCRILSQLFFNARKHQEFKLGITGADHITFRFDETPADIESIVHKVKAEKAAETPVEDQHMSISKRARSKSPSVKSEGTPDQEEFEPSVTTSTSRTKASTSRTTSNRPRTTIGKRNQNLGQAVKYTPAVGKQKKRVAGRDDSNVEDETLKRVKIGNDRSVDRAEIPDHEIIDDARFFTIQNSQPQLSASMWAAVDGSALAPEPPPRHRVLPSSSIMTSYTQAPPTFHSQSYASPNMPSLPALFTEWPGNIPRSTAFPHCSSSNPQAQHSFDASTTSFNSMVSLPMREYSTNGNPTSIISNLTTDLSSWYASSPEE